MPPFRHLALIALLFVSAATFAGERPNVLFIAIDDMNQLGIPGNQAEVHIPHITRLAERGTLFTNAHCAAPACNPSRVSVMTGVRPSTSGVYLNGQDWRVNEYLSSIPTLPGHFRENGYKTLGGGKLYHAASLNEKGFTGLIDPEPWDEFFPSKDRQMPAEVLPEVFPTNGSTQFYKGFFDWAELDITDSEMADGQVVTWAEKQLSQDHEQPLFLAVGIYRPHIPWYTPKEWFDLYPEDIIKILNFRDGDLDDIPEAGRAMARRSWQEWMITEDKWPAAVRAYLASLSFADAQVGRLLDALDNGPLADNTVVVLWSDHGYHLGHKEHWEKFALWNQASRVPMIVSSPDIEASAPCSHPTSLLDLYPTLSTLCRTDAPDHLEGRSLVDLMKAPASESDRAVLITHDLGNNAVQSHHWRYIRYEDGSEELYDHRNDPDEFTNLAGNPEFNPVKEALAVHLPDSNAEPDPIEDWRRKREFEKNRK